MMPFLYVFIGGGLGSVARYSIARWMSTHEFVFPWATLLANVLACIILGVLTAYASKYYLPDNYRLLFMVGFCGGFSTFSTFSSETFKLLSSGQTAYAFANISLSLLLCLFSIYLGMRLVR